MKNFKKYEILSSLVKRLLLEVHPDFFASDHVLQQKNVQSIQTITSRFLKKKGSRNGHKKHALEDRVDDRALKVSLFGKSGGSVISWDLHPFQKLHHQTRQEGKENLELQKIRFQRELKMIANPEDRDSWILSGWTVAFLQLCKILKVPLDIDLSARIQESLADHHQTPPSKKEQQEQEWDKVSQQVPFRDILKIKDLDREIGLLKSSRLSSKEYLNSKPKLLFFDSSLSRAQKNVCINSFPILSECLGKRKDMVSILVSNKFTSYPGILVIPFDFSADTLKEFLTKQNF